MSGSEVRRPTGAVWGAFGVCIVVALAGIFLRGDSPALGWSLIVIGFAGLIAWRFWARQDPKFRGIDKDEPNRSSSSL